MSVVVRVAARGDGVTADGRHAALAAPGDEVLENGTIVPGSHHQTPPCRHFPRCGGCQLQHLDDASWSDFILDRVSGALAAQGVVAGDIRGPALSAPNTRRRASLHAARVGKDVVLGFNAASSHAIVDCRECWVLLPELFGLIAPLRELLATLMTPRSRVEVRLTRVDQGIDVLLGGVTADGLITAEAINAFAERHRLARLTIDGGEGPETRWEPDPVSVTLGGVAVPFPVGGFLQATDEGEAALVASVRKGVGEARVIADLFCGLGTFALALPRKVYAAEAARDPILALKAAAARAGRSIFADHRDLYRRPLTIAELDRFEAVVLDPPRAGAREQATALAGAKVPVITYVSCNPSSFARDAKLLCDGGYRLEWVQPVGQFRWSTHVELAGRFIR